MNDGVVYLLSYLILPVLLIVVGLVMWRFPPGYGGSVGYRTKRSRSSRQAWDFAQVYWGRLILGTYCIHQEPLKLAASSSTSGVM